MSDLNRRGLHVDYDNNFIQTGGSIKDENGNVIDPPSQQQRGRGPRPR